MLIRQIFCLTLIVFSCSCVQQFFKETKLKTKSLMDYAGLQLEKYSKDFKEIKGVVSYIRENLDFKVTLLVCGETSAGKSTLINMLLSADLNELTQFSLTGEHQVTNQFIIYEMMNQDTYSLSDAEGNLIIQPHEDLRQFLKELRDWEKSVEVKGNTVKIKLPLSSHKSLQSDGDPFILIDTPGFDDFQNFEFFQTFLKDTSYTPIAILLQDFMKPTGSSYSNFNVISKIKEKVGGNLGVAIFYTKIEMYMNVQRFEAKDLGESQKEIENYAEEKYEKHRQVITYELGKLKPMLTEDYDLKLVNTKFRNNQKHSEKVKEYDLQNREETVKMIKKLKKEMDRAKNFVIYMFTVRNTYVHLKQLTEPIIASKFGQNASLKEIEDRLNGESLFFYLYNSVQEAVEEALSIISTIPYTDQIQLKNDMFSECEKILRNKVLEVINLRNIDLQMEKLFHIHFKSERGYGQMVGGLMMSGIELPIKLFSKLTDGEYKAKTLKASEIAEEVQFLIQTKVIESRRKIMAEFERVKRRVQLMKEYDLLNIMTTLRRELSETLETAIFGEF